MFTERIKMKKLGFVKVLFMLLLILGVKVINVEDTVEDVELCAKIDMYDTLDEVETDSDLIVVGTKIAEDEPTIVYEGDAILYAYTLSDFHVAEVLKKGKEESYEGTEIKILENEFYDEESRVNYHIAGYNKMQTGESYILYLSYSEENNWYVPTGVVAGKIPMKDGENNVTTTDEHIKEEVEMLSKEAEKKYNFKQLEKDIRDSRKRRHRGW